MYKLEIFNAFALVNKNESFIRWQGRSIEELGKTISLLLALALALATIGFIASKLSEDNFIFKNHLSKISFLVGTNHPYLQLLHSFISYFKSFKKH